MIKKNIATIITLLLFLPAPFSAQTFNDAYSDFKAQNYGSAFKKLKVLAEKNDDRAQSLLGYMYLNGTGTTKNGREAVKWYKKSAAANNIFAHSEIGRLYHAGDFVPQSFSKAGFHYKKCADLSGNNDRDGLCHEKTGFAYLNKWYGNTSHDNAQKYYKKAYQLGGEAYYFMSLIMGMEGNKVQELMWMNICAAFNPDCKDVKEELFSKATQSQKRNAQQMSNECLDSNFENCAWTY
jgi:TPR repeat protein